MRHTPGPWKWSKARKSSNFGNYTAFVQAPVPGKQPFIATIAKVLGGPEDKPEFAEANGRLIAAAPDLLDALFDALAQLECFHDEQTSGGSESNLTPIIKTIDDAIEKATGMKRCDYICKVKP